MAAVRTRCGAGRRGHLGGRRTRRAGDRRPTLNPPYSVLAIGDPPTLAAAMNIPGGAMDSIERVGAICWYNRPTGSMSTPCGNRNPPNTLSPSNEDHPQRRAVSEIPSDLYYTEEHEWVLRTGGDTVRVGITDFAQSSLGDVVFVQLPDVGPTSPRANPSARWSRRNRCRTCTRRSRRKSLRSTVIWRAARVGQLRSLRRRLAGGLQVDADRWRMGWRPCSTRTLPRHGHRVTGC